MKFADFTSLQYIAIPLRVLFGSYIYDGDVDWLPKLRAHLPPSLKVLFLQDIAINERHIPGDNSDIPDLLLSRGRRQCICQSHGSSKTLLSNSVLLLSV